jgi:hypothetical protein
MRKKPRSPQKEFSFRMIYQSVQGDAMARVHRVEVGLFTTPFTFDLKLIGIVGVLR